MKRNIFIPLFVSLLIGCTPKEAPLNWTPFQWESATISGKYIEKAFLYVPIQIEDIPVSFTMQLDLGTEQTVLYGNAIDSYLKQYPSIANKLDTTTRIFQKINLHTESIAFNNIDMGYMKEFGDAIHPDSLYTQTPKHIGTMAPDLFQNQILVIDYKNERFAITDSLPNEYKELPAAPFEQWNGILKIPFTINGEEQKLMFDTGSSPFQLATTKERALAISNSVVTDSLSGPLWWGQDITFYGLPINKSIRFGGHPIKSDLVYYDKEGLWDNIYRTLDVWGLTGNAYFFDNIVIIDYKNKLFRVK